MRQQIKTSLLTMSESKRHDQRINRDRKRIVTARAHLSLLSPLIKIKLIGVSLVTLPLSSYALISATTSKTIQGSAPYFLLDNGTEKTKILTTDELVGFQYIDKSGNVALADKSMNGTIIKLGASMKQSDLLAMVPIDGEQHSLIEVLARPNTTLFIGDDDGDAIGTDAAGLITATLKYDGVKITPTNAPFDLCKGQYTLEISATADTYGKLQAKTIYGDPYYRDYEASTATYTLLPDSLTPYACWAQPNLTSGTGGYAGPVSQWDSNKGFLRQSAADPTKNFPTTGFNNGYFNLTLAGTTASQVIYDTAVPTSIAVTGSTITGIVTSTEMSGITLELSAANMTTNVLKVVLKGPNMVTAASSIPKHTATTFMLNSGVTTVYSFTIDKWFIARKGIDSSYDDTTNSALAYCTTLGDGGKYKVPSVLGDYTNASVTIPGGSGGNYTRAIGGGLFAEWGYAYGGYYTGSDFEYSYYWASDPYGRGYQYNVSSNYGYVNYNSLSIDYYRAACVSPL